MTTRPPDDAPLTDVPGDDDDDTDLPWVVVSPDNSAITGPLIKGAPVILFGAIRMGVMMAKGKGTSAGAGPLGLVVGLLAVALPFLWVAGLSGLRLMNAGVRLEDGVLTVRDIWHRRRLAAPVAAITGLHTMRIPVDGEHKTRIIVTSANHRPVVINPRLWKTAELTELWQALGLPIRDHGFLAWPVLRLRFPGVRVPWRHVHYVMFTLLIVLGAIAYIALMVNLPFLLDAAGPAPGPRDRATARPGAAGRSRRAHGRSPAGGPRRRRWRGRSAPGRGGPCGRRPRRCRCRSPSSCCPGTGRRGRSRGRRR